MLQVVKERESNKVLAECGELQIRKSNDYQNPMSTVRQADHYPRGISTIMDMVHQKNIRAKSLLETIEANRNSTYQPNFESLEDTLKDMINYLSFGVSYLRGKMDGQNPDHDIFNRRKQVTSIENGTGVMFRNDGGAAQLPSAILPANTTFTGTLRSKVTIKEPLAPGNYRVEMRPDGEIVHTPIGIL